MDLSASLNALRPGLTDPMTGTLAPNHMWDLVGLAVGSAHVEHIFCSRDESDEDTTWGVTVLTDVAVISCIGHANFKGWKGTGGEATEKHTVTTNAVAHPLSAMRCYRVSDTRTLYSGGDWEAAGRYVFEFDGDFELVLDAQALTRSEQRDRTEKAATFLIDQFGK